MSSILDALEKLESRRAQTGGPEPPHRTRRSITPLLAGAALVAFAAGIAIAVMWLRPRPGAPLPAAVAQLTPPPTAPPPAAAPPATLPPPPARAPAAGPAPARPTEQPWAEVVAPAPARDLAPPASATTARTPAQERSPHAAEPAAVIAAVTPPAPAPPPPAAAPAARTPARPAGAPGVRVSFLVYSGVPDRRTVALAIDQAGLVTLHEGESANGLSVAQILPDGVELTWQGQSFTVPARD